MRPALFTLTLFGMLAWLLAGTSSTDGQETKPAEAKPTDKKPAEAKPEESPAIKIPNVKLREKDKEKSGAKPADPAKNPAKAVVKKPGEPIIITPEREAAALAFANLHHSELTALLTALSTRNPAQYQNALRDLYRASERLAQVQEKDAERYELDLADWKVSSRIQILVAKLSMAPSQAVKDELRLLIGEQADIRIKMLQLERDRAAARQAKAEELLQAAESGREAEVKRRYEMFLRGPKPKTKAADKDDKVVEKPAAKSSVEKSADKPEPKKTAE